MINKALGTPCNLHYPVNILHFLDLTQARGDLIQCCFKKERVFGFVSLQPGPEGQRGSWKDGTPVGTAGSHRAALLPGGSAQRGRGPGAVRLVLAAGGDGVPVPPADTEGGGTESVAPGSLPPGVPCPAPSLQASWLSLQPVAAGFTPLSHSVFHGSRAQCFLFTLALRRVSVLTS